MFRVREHSGPAPPGNPATARWWRRARHSSGPAWRRRPMP